MGRTTIYITNIPLHAPSQRDASWVAKIMFYYWYRSVGTFCETTIIDQISVCEDTDQVRGDTEKKSNVPMERKNRVCLCYL